jgi:hypothetical protein
VILQSIDGRRSKYSRNEPPRSSLLGFGRSLERKRQGCRTPHSKTPLQFPSRRITYFMCWVGSPNKSTYCLRGFRAPPTAASPSSLGEARKRASAAASASGLCICSKGSSNSSLIPCSAGVLLIGDDLSVTPGSIEKAACFAP